ncbi:MAG TPA: glycoside hydrolase family 44 protein [Polyangiaceae bacterium]|jgi:hypothetical protein
MTMRRRWVGRVVLGAMATLVAAACACPCLRSVPGSAPAPTQASPTPAKAGGVARSVPSESVTLSVACGARATRISPLIYGLAYSHNDDAQPQQWQMGATIRRWGGNNMSRYNWEIHAMNLDSDWFWENVEVAPYTKFLDEDAEHGIESALTVPMIGWVAKDGTSVSFPVSVVGPQQKTDPWKAEAGNGMTADGKEIPAGPPTRTSVEASPEWMKRWIQAIRANDAKTGRRSVHEYILDNEPALWNHTHRDVRPEPLGYDELVDRTIRYGRAIREADPDAVIAGPAEWGWLNYIYSAKDTAPGSDKADRKAHGDLPLIEYYLRKLHEYEQQTGTRILDVVDLHYYPEAQAHGGTSEADKDAWRIRSTRSLWDPDYTDESWIHEKIRLLPRVKEWIDKDYPGRGFSIGEWNYGGEGRMSAGIATAEALGRYAQYGVRSAFYWTFPPAGSPTMLAFVAYRNFDGKGGRFLDWSLPTTLPAGSPASLFASRDEEGKHVVLVALNTSREKALAAHIDLTGCGDATTREAYAVVEGAHAVADVGAVGGSASGVDAVLPPYSITVIDVRLAAPMSGSVAP